MLSLISDTLIILKKTYIRPFPKFQAFELSQVEIFESLKEQRQVHQRKSELSQLE